MNILKKTLLFLLFLGSVYAIGVLSDNPEDTGVKLADCIEGTYRDTDNICKEPGELRK
jgi:hypothetical protein